MIKKYFGISVLFFASFYIFYYTFEKSDTLKNPIYYPRKEIIPKQNSTTTVESPSRTSQTCEVKSPIFTGAMPLQFDPSLVDGALSQAYLDINSVIRNSSHDPIANIALFRLAASCFTNDLKNRQKSGSACPANAGVLPINTTPLELLQRAAELGSEQAKLMYALNAPMAAEFFRAQHSQQGTQQAQEILAQAETFGDSAARAGIPDALRYMSRVYESGMFGPRDIERAYIYALPLKNVGSKEDLSVIENLGSRLNEKLRKGAEAKAFGCSRYTEINILANPFKN